MSEYSLTSTNRGSSRRGTTNSMKLQARQTLEAIGGPVASRKSLPRHPAAATRVSATQQPRTRAYQEPEQEEYDTASDPDFRPNVMRRRPVIEPETSPGGRGPRRGPHPLWWIGSITLVLIILFWIVGTIGASFWVSHFGDSGQYGSLHGQAVTGNFVENQQPITVIGIICHDRVQIIVVNGNNSKLYTGSDLSTNGFPDPDNANVQLQAGDFGGGHLDLQVTVLSDQFPTPFQRFSIKSILYGNGDGTFKATQQ